MWSWLVVVIVIITFQAISGFLPNKWQSKKRVRIPLVIVTILILCRTAYQEVDTVRSRSYAFVTPDGQITESNNFPWKVTHVESSEEGIYFIIDKRGDGTDVTVTPDNRTYEPHVDGVTTGVRIQFKCPPSCQGALKPSHYGRVQNQPL